MEGKRDDDSRHHHHQQQQQQEQAPPQSADDPVQFDPTRMIGIIQRKALIKQLAAAYQAQCRASAQDLSRLQAKWNQFQYYQKRVAEEAPQPQPQPVRPPAKRTKKAF